MRKKGYLCAAALVMMLSSVQPVSAKTELSVTECCFTPTVLTNEITSETTKINVYVYADTTLYVKNGNNVIFEQFYEEEGLKEVCIPKQKGKSKLEFSLIYKESGKKGDIVSKRVVQCSDITEVEKKGIKQPVVQKTITNKTKRIKVNGYKNMTLVIRNEKKVIKKVKFNKKEQKNIQVAVKDNEKLYFYFKKGNNRSKILTREIKDVIAPEKPEVTLEGSELCINGEIGTKVYVKKGSDTWSYSGMLLSEEGVKINRKALSEENPYYRIRLKDASGNISEVVKVKENIDATDEEIVD